MKLIQLRNFLATARCGTLQASARELGISQNALIHSLQALERDLRAALFRRDKNNMILTPIGTIFARRVATAQRDLDRATHDLGHAPASIPDSVAIGMDADAATTVLPKLLLPFQQRFGGVGLRIAHGGFATLEHAVRDGALDCYVGPIWPHHRIVGLTVARLYDVERVVVARIRHPLAQATALRDLADARWITASHAELAAMFQAHDLAEPRVAVECETALNMLASIAASDILMVVPATMLPMIAAVGGLAVLPLAGALYSPATCMVTRAQASPSIAATGLRELILTIA